MHVTNVEVLSHCLSGVVCGTTLFPSVPGNMCQLFLFIKRIFALRPKQNIDRNRKLMIYTFATTYCLCPICDENTRSAPELDVQMCV